MLPWDYAWSIVTHANCYNYLSNTAPTKEKGAIWSYFLTNTYISTYSYTLSSTIC
jgi:hypothetical protein